MSFVITYKRNITTIVNLIVRIKHTNDASTEVLLICIVSVYLLEYTLSRVKLIQESLPVHDDITADWPARSHFDERRFAYCAVFFSFRSFSFSRSLHHQPHFSVSLFLYVVAARVRATEMRELLWLGIHYLRGSTEEPYKKWAKLENLFNWHIQPCSRRRFDSALSIEHKVNKRELTFTKYTHDYKTEEEINWRRVQGLYSINLVESVH